MASTKSHLDKELDSYMNQAQEGAWDWGQVVHPDAIFLLDRVCYDCFDKEIVFNATVCKNVLSICCK
jgi:hypothetical protein